MSLVAELDTPVTIDRLVDPMLQWERERTADAGEKCWFDVHEELFLVDLNVLDGAGVIEFDVERGLVSSDEGA